MKSAPNSSTACLYPIKNFFRLQAESPLATWLLFSIRPATQFNRDYACVQPCLLGGKANTTVEDLLLGLQGSKEYGVLETLVIAVGILEAMRATRRMS